MNYRKIVIGQLIVGALVVLIFLANAVFIGGLLLYSNLAKSDLPLIARDLAIFVYANHKAGDKVPATDIDFSDGITLDVEENWKMQVNSMWLARMTRAIGPVFPYEDLSAETLYPSIIFFAPFQGSRSFHVLGTVPQPGVVLINERMLLADEPDERAILATLVHELVHVQGGRFTFSGACGESQKCWDDESVKIESNTSAATIEILAAMCNYRRSLACKAFWSEVSDLSKASIEFRLSLHGLDNVFDFLLDVLMRDAVDERSYEKSDRHWADDPEGLQELIFKYQVKPWEELVIPGICGKRMNTGLVNWTAGNGSGYVEAMSFDDTRALAGPLTRLINCGSYK